MADGLVQRYAAGVLGVLVLLAWTLVRRHRRLPLMGPLTDVVPAVLGTAAFGVAAVTFAALAGQRFRLASGNGAGQWVSAAVIASMVSVGYAVVFVRRARALPPVDPGAVLR